MAQTGVRCHKKVLPPEPAGQRDANTLETRNGRKVVRSRVSAGADKAPVLALQKQFALVPLSLFGKAESAPAGAHLPRLPAIDGDELGFFTQLGAALNDNAVQPADHALFAQFARIGLTAAGFDASKLSPHARQGLTRALQDGPAAAVSAMVTAATQRNGWTWAVGLDSFGFNYPLRALVARPYHGGNGEKEAMYPLRYTDSKGQLLSGTHSYTLRFDHAPPVDAFWSLTVYNAQDMLLVANPIGRYKVGSDTPGLVTAADGSITVSAQHPAPAESANWLPTPERPFYLVLRLYQLKAEVLDGTYNLPDVVGDVP
jgi:hypothetical protein